MHAVLTVNRVPGLYVRLALVLAVTKYAVVQVQVEDAEGGPVVLIAHPREVDLSVGVLSDAALHVHDVSQLA